MDFPTKMPQPEKSTAATLFATGVIVNRNGARRLETGLPSLLAQIYHPLESIVVGNASKDNSAAVGEKHEVLDRNVGLTPALNKAAEAAYGEHLLFLNSDMRFHWRPDSGIGMASCHKSKLTLGLVEVPKCLFL